MTRLLWIALASAACGSTGAPPVASGSAAPPVVVAAPRPDAAAAPAKGYCYTSTDPAHYGHCEDTQADCDAAQKLESFARSACEAKSVVYCWWVPPGDAVCAPTLADCERSHANVPNSRSCEPT